MDTDSTQSALKDLPDEVMEQMLFAELVNNAEFTSQVVHIFKESWFSDDELRPMSRLVIGWRERFSSNITAELIDALLRKYIQNNPNCGISPELCLKKFNKALNMDLGGMSNEVRIRTIKDFIKKNILKEAIIEGAKILSKDGIVGVTDACAEILENAEKLSIIGEANYLTYSVNAVTEGEQNNLQEKILNDHYTMISNPSAKISTGWTTLDLYTNGGWPVEGKFIGIIMGQSGLGKTVALANLGYNCLKQNLRVVVFTMELSEDLYGKRFDSLMSRVPLDDLGPLVGTVKSRVADFFKQHPRAELTIKEFPPKGANINTFSAFISNLCKEKGKDWKPDVIIVDYLNLVAAAGNVGDSMFEEGLKVSEQLRALSYKWEAPVLTAVQINTEGMQNKNGPEMENISQSRGIAHTADFMMGIYRDKDNPDEILGKIIKSRLGKANGQMKFNRDDETLLMSDAGEDRTVHQEETKNQPNAQSEIPKELM